MKHLEVRELVRCGIFIALITVGSWIRIPVGTDVYTLQFLFTLLAGLVLGARLGAIAVGAYVLLGLVGVPVGSRVMVLAPAGTDQKGQSVPPSAHVMDIDAAL